MIFVISNLIRTKFYCFFALLKRNSPSFMAVGIFFLMLTLGGSIMIWRQKQQILNNRKIAQDIASTQAYSLQRQLDRSLSATFALAVIVQQSGKIDNFKGLAAKILQTYGGISNLQLAPDGIIQNIYPLSGNEKAIGLNLLEDPQRRTTTLKTIEARQLTLNGPFLLKQGGIGMVGNFPIFIKDLRGVEKFWGFVSALIKIEDLLNATPVEKNLLNNGYDYEIYRIDPDTQHPYIFARSSSQPLKDPVLSLIQIPNGEWTLAISPPKGWLLSSLNFGEIFLVFFISSLVAILAYLLMKDRLTIQKIMLELIYKNNKLNREIEERKKVEIALQEEQKIVQEQSVKLKKAHEEIIQLNQQLQSENCRMSGELDVTQKLQKMFFPKEIELRNISDLEIATFTESATEVGGDYYDVLAKENQIKIAIGDITGHGLESGVLMMMAQTAVRSLLEAEIGDEKKFLEILNRVLYKNLQRINCEKNMTLAILDYHNKTVKLSGQHEEIIFISSQGNLQLIDTLDLGFPLGLVEEITGFIDQFSFFLNPGDTIVIYTDGITEAANIHHQLYGLDRLCEIIKTYYQLSCQELCQKIIQDVKHHIGSQVLYDDLTLLVIKQN